MPADLTSVGLIASCRRNAALGQPNANAFPADSDLLAWINEEMSNALVTLLMRPREEYFVEHYAFATVAGTAEYRIPIRGLWDDTRDVQVQQGDATAQWISLPRIQPEQIPLYNLGNSGGQYAQAYYLRAGKVGLVPTPAGGQAARINFFQRPGFIVPAASYSLLTGLSGSAPTYTATVASTTGLASVVSFDFTSNFAPYDVLLSGVTGVVASSTTLTLTLSAADAATLTANLSSAFALNAGDAPGPQITQDLVPYLEQRATYRALLGKKDADGAKLQLQSCEMTRQEIVRAMNQRSDGLNRKVVGRAFGFGQRLGYPGWGPAGAS